MRKYYMEVEDGFCGVAVGKNAQGNSAVHRKLGMGHSIRHHRRPTV